VQVEEQKKHLEQEYVVNGQSSENMAPLLTSRGASQSERKSIQSLYPECLGICDRNLGYESGEYGNVGENRTNDGQMDVFT